MSTISVPTNKTQPRDDERLTAAIAHASIVANISGLLGLVLVVVLWATQRERSRYVRAHIVQALAFQGVTILGLVALLALWSACLLLSMLPAALRPELYVDGTLPDTFWLALFGLFVPLIYGCGATIYALYGAYQVYHGRPFVYPLIGRSVRRDLGLPNPPAAAPEPAAEMPAALPVVAAAPAPASPVPPAAAAPAPANPAPPPVTATEPPTALEAAAAPQTPPVVAPPAPTASMVAEAAPPAVEAASAPEKPARPETEPIVLPPAPDVFPPGPAEPDPVALVAEDDALESKPVDQVAER